MRPAREALALRGFAVLLLAVGLSACGRADGTPPALEAGEAHGVERVAPEWPGTDPALGFSGSEPSLDALGSHVLRALALGDREALASVRLTEEEHNGVVWPELPASAPEVNFPLDYAWMNIENRDARSVARILPLYEGRDLRFQAVECRGEPQAFETFVVETDCWVVFHSGDAMLERWEAQLFKDVLVRGGGYKIFRFYDEEPRPYRAS